MRENDVRKVDALCLDISRKVVAELYTTGARRRRLQPRHWKNLQKSVSILIKDAIACHATHPYAPVPISKRPEAYGTKHLEYRGVPFSMHVNLVYPALQRLGYLQVAKKGYLDRATGDRRREKYTATKRLIDVFKLEKSIDNQFPNDTRATRLAVSNQSIPAHHPIVVSTRVDKTREVHIPPLTRVHKDMKQRVTELNRYLKHFWIDLKLSNRQWSELGRGWKDKKGHYHTLNLTKRSLYRVFHDDMLSTGGRFYGGWWQEIPSKFRQNIIVNGKWTVECDYSGLHPSILYAKEGQPIPEEPYGEIAGMEHRSIIKACFNAMLNSKKRTKRAPREIDISPTGLSWEQIVNRIEAFHEPIKHHFFSNAGMWLMREDSELAETIMLAYFRCPGQFCLPVHDSFIVFWSWEHDLHDRMVGAFFERYGIEPKIKVTRRQTDPDQTLQLIEPKEISVDDIIATQNLPHILRHELFQVVN